MEILAELCVWCTSTYIQRIAKELVTHAIRGPRSGYQGYRRDEKILPHKYIVPEQSHDGAHRGVPDEGVYISNVVEC